MVYYIFHRLLIGLVVVLMVVTVVFILVRLTGDPAAALLPDQATIKDYEILLHDLGLDRPLYIQYIILIKNYATGDFGFSAKTRIPIKDMLLQRLPNSMKLAAVSLAMMIIMALPMGVISAVNRGRLFDWIARIFVALGQALPVFWLSLILMQISAIHYKIFPVGGMENFSSYVLPAFSLALYPTAGIMRVLRSSMIEVLDSEYIKMIRIKGVSQTKVIWKHALRNAIISVVTLSGLYFALLVMSSVVVETIFMWPGIGRMLWEGVLSRDFTVVQSVVFVLSLLVIIVNLVVDILYRYIDPRIRSA